MQSDEGVGDAKKGKKRNGHRGAGTKRGGGFKARRAFGARVLRGELRVSFTTRWWYEVSGSNKLAARLKALRQRHMVPVDKLSTDVAGRVGDKVVDGRVSFNDIVAMTPTRKSASFEKVKSHISFHVQTHNIRTAFIYRRVLVSSLYRLSGGFISRESLCNHTIAQRRAKMTARIERERAMRAFAHALSLGMGKKVVVVVGDKDVTTFKYYRPRPHREFLRVLAEVTNLIIIGEYFTSKKAHCCAQRKPDGGDAWNEAGPKDIVRHLCYLRSCIACIVVLHHAACQSIY